MCMWACLSVCLHVCLPLVCMAVWGYVMMGCCRAYGPILLGGLGDERRMVRFGLAPPAALGYGSKRFDNKRGICLSVCLERKCGQFHQWTQPTPLTKPCHHLPLYPRLPQCEGGWVHLNHHRNFHFTSSCLAALPTDREVDPNSFNNGIWMNGGIHF